MAKFKDPKHSINLSKGNMGKGSHSHIILDLDGSKFVATDAVTKVVDTVRGLTFKVVASHVFADLTRIWAKIRHNTPKGGGVKNAPPPPDGTLTISLTVNMMSVTNMLPVNYITDDDPCDT